MFLPRYLKLVCASFSYYHFLGLHPHANPPPTRLRSGSWNSSTEHVVLFNSSNHYFYWVFKHWKISYDEGVGNRNLRESAWVEDELWEILVWEVLLWPGSLSSRKSASGISLRILSLSLDQGKVAWPGEIPIRRSREILDRGRISCVEGFHRAFVFIWPTYIKETD